MASAAATKLITDFFNQFPEEQIPAKTILLQDQAFPEHAYYIADGIVCTKLLTKHGEEIIVNIMRNPSFFPLTAIVNQTPNLYIFEAKTELTVRVAPIEKVRSWLLENTAVLHDTLSRVLVGMTGQMEEKAVLMVGSSRQRLLQGLSILSRRFGAEHGDRVIVNLPFTHAELASLVGVSRETITRELSTLKQEGIIEGVHSGVIEISFPKLIKALDAF